MKFNFSRLFSEAWSQAVTPSNVMTGLHRAPSSERQLLSRRMTAVCLEVLLGHLAVHLVFLLSYRAVCLVLLLSCCAVHLVLLICWTVHLVLLLSCQAFCLVLLLSCCAVCFCGQLKIPTFTKFHIIMNNWSGFVFIMKVMI